MSTRKKSNRSASARSVATLVRKSYAAYVAKDRAALEAILAPDFVFTSPVDAHLDRARYFERCWPFSARVRSFRIEKLFVDGNEAFVRYLCTPKRGRPFRNTEFFRVARGKIRSVDVYFGRNVTAR